MALWLHYSIECTLLSNAETVCAPVPAIERENLSSGQTVLFEAVGTTTADIVQGRPQDSAKVSLQVNKCQLWVILQIYEANGREVG